MRANDSLQSVNISLDEVKDTTANPISDFRTHQSLIKHYIIILYLNQAFQGNVLCDFSFFSPFFIPSFARSW